MTSPFLHIWQTEISILSEKDNSFKRFILSCNYNYVQQKTRKHRRGQGRIALLIRRILSNWNKKHTHSICTFQKNIIIIIISQNVETLFFPQHPPKPGNKKTFKKYNYFTSSDPHHDMLGGGCQVRVVIENMMGRMENLRTLISGFLGLVILVRWALVTMFLSWTTQTGCRIHRTYVSPDRVRWG